MNAEAPLTSAPAGDARAAAGHLAPSPTMRLRLLAAACAALSRSDRADAQIIGYGMMPNACDDEALAARAAEVEEACCPNGGHRRAQSGSCSLPNVCPSASCADTFVPFFEQCEAQVRE